MARRAAWVCIGAYLALVACGGVGSEGGLGGLDIGPLPSLDAQADAPLPDAAPDPGVPDSGLADLPDDGGAPDAAPDQTLDAGADTPPDPGADDAPPPDAGAPACADDPGLCDDANPCTDTWCDPAQGCRSTCTCQWTCASDADCYQGLCELAFCVTLGDEACGGSQCEMGPADCPDPVEPCLGPACDPVLGCVAEPLTGPACDDGDPRTSDDHCEQGICLGTCKPDCGERECGDDGCGSSCGDCPEWHGCDQAGACVPVCPPLCASLPGCEGPKVWGGHAYYLCGDALEWAQADAWCYAHGAHLATIANKDEDDFLAAMLGWNATAWIGLHDRAVEGTFVWVTNEPLGYDAWGFGEPSDGVLGLGSEDCVVLDSGGSWNDKPCDSNRRFFCEISP